MVENKFLNIRDMGRSRWRVLFGRIMVSFGFIVIRI